jgi:hypothetical protein
MLSVTRSAVEHGNKVELSEGSMAVGEQPEGPSVMFGPAGDPLMDIGLRMYVGANGCLYRLID